MFSLRTLTTLITLAVILLGLLALAGCGGSGNSAKDVQANAAASAATPSPSHKDNDDDDNQPAPDARIAVMVDESASFEKDLPTAARIIARFIRENAIGGSCEVYLIALDRNSRILNFYSAEELMDSSGSKILQKIQAVTPLDGTDIVGGLKLAALKLNKDMGPKPAHRMLLAFTDGFVDPAKQQLSQTHTFPPLEDFDWNQLSGVDTHFYFVDDANEAGLTSLLQQHGIQGQVLDPSESRKTVLSTAVDKTVGDDE